MSTPHFESVDDIQAYLARFTDFEKMVRFTMKRDTFDLGRMVRFLDALGAPQTAYEIVHIAGTKGKGSVTHILAALLQGQGVKSGRFTSPHLETVNERIHFADADISDAALIDAFDAMAEQLGRVQETGDQLTFFEMITAAALVAFKSAGVEVAVLETGLGGRLDATNACMPALTMITNIGHDHHDKLGEELTDIAYEKSGIIKPAVPMITGSYDHEALEYVLRRARDEDAPVRRYKNDFEALNIQSTPSGTSFSLRSQRYRLEKLESGLVGSHQAVNAAMAVDALYWLCELGVVGTIDEVALRGSLRDLCLPGRFEIVPQKSGVTVVLDVAHNAESIAAFAKTMKQRFDGKELRIVFGVAKDKDIGAIVEALAELDAKIILTTFDSPRACPVDHLHDLWMKYAGRPVSKVPNPHHALADALEDASQNSVVAVVGSFYLAGELRSTILEGKA